MLYKVFWNWIKVSKKNKVVAGKTPFFVTGPFCSHHYFALTVATGMALLNGNDAF